MLGLVFTDLHVHKHKFGGVVTEEGKHTRLMDCVSVLDQTYQHMLSSNISYRFFCGDMFHVRGKLAPSILNPVIEHFSRVHEEKAFKDFLLVGNHDMEHRTDGEHAMKALGELRGVHVLEDHGYRVVSSFDMFGLGWVAYEPDVKRLKEKVQAVAAMRREDGQEHLPQIFLIHHGVDGAMPSIPNMGFAPKDLPHDDFDLIFCGDYHTHKELIPNKAWMVGSPLQHNFGDAGQRRGWMTFDTSPSKTLFHENVRAPFFVNWQDGGVKPTVFKGNFARVRAEDEARLREMEGIALEAGALAVQAELIRDMSAIDRAEVDLGMSTGDMFRTWLEKQGIEDEEQVKRVLALNEEIMAEAGI